MTTDEKITLSKAAIAHVLNALHDDPAKYWLMGSGTGSWEKLTTAAAALFNIPVEKVRTDFQPEKHRHEQFCEQREKDLRLLEYCREHGITLEYCRENGITGE